MSNIVYVLGLKEVAEKIFSKLLKCCYGEVFCIIMIIVLFFLADLHEPSANQAIGERSRENTFREKVKTTQL